MASIERRAGDRHRHDAHAGRRREVGLDDHAGDLREAAGDLLDLAEAVLERGADVLAGQLELHRPVAEGQLGEDVAAGELGAGRDIRGRRECRRHW